MAELPISTLISTIPERLSYQIKLLFKQYSIPRWIVFLLDSMGVFLVFIFAYILRFNFVMSGFL